MGNGYVAVGGTYTDDVIVKNGSGNVVDPDTDSLVLTIKDPDGATVATIEQDDLTRLAEGHYQYSWSVPEDADTGAWSWRWTATVEGADLPDAVATVVVLPSGSLTSPRAYATVTDLAKLLPAGQAQSDTDFLLDQLVRASALIDSRCHRDFYRHPVSGQEERTFDIRAWQGGTIDVPEGVVSISLLEWAYQRGGTYTPFDSSAWSLRPSPAGAGEPYWSILLADAPPALVYPGQATLRATGVWGFASVPEIIRSGTLAYARELVALKLTPAGAPRGDFDPGGLTPLLPTDTYNAIRWGESVGPAGSWFA